MCTGTMPHYTTKAGAREANRQRGRDKPWRKLYSTPAWRKMRAHQLSTQPLCERCLAQGRTTAATVAHHTKPHNGDADLFFSTPLASSCAPCHDTIEQGIEVRGYERGNHPDGRPTDPSHPWNR